MNQLIKDRYEVELQNATQSFEGFPPKIDKRIQTINNVLSEFLYDWGNIKEIDEELLPNMEKVLNNVIDGEHIQSNTVGVFLTSQQAKLLRLTNETASLLNPDFILPLCDFKEIVEGWRDFLLEPPLDGTLVC